MAAAAPVPTMCQIRRVWPNPTGIRVMTPDGLQDVRVRNNVGLRTGQSIACIKRPEDGVWLVADPRKKLPPQMVPPVRVPGETLAPAAAAAPAEADLDDDQETAAPPATTTAATDALSLHPQANVTSTPEPTA